MTLVSIRTPSKTKVAVWSTLADPVPAHAVVADPQEFKRDQYLGLYADIHGGPEEDQVHYIHGLARDGLRKLGHHGVVSVMGVPRSELPRWQDIQIVTGQLATQPLLDDHPVGTERAAAPPMPT